MLGVPTFMELAVPDADKAQEFYRTIFPDWTFGPKHNGFRVHTPGPTMGIHGGDEDRRLVSYLSVADLDLAVKQIRELGGQAGDIMEGGPDYGRFAECVDNQGVHFGLHQPPVKP